MDNSNKKFSSSKANKEYKLMKHWNSKKKAKIRKALIKKTYEQFNFKLFVTFLCELKSKQGKSNFYDKIVRRGWRVEKQVMKHEVQGFKASFYRKSF